MSTSLFDTLSHGLVSFLAPLGRLVEKPQALDRLLAELGVMPSADRGGLLAVLQTVAQMKEQIEVLRAQSLPSFASVTAVLDASAKAFTALQTFEMPDGPLGSAEKLGQDLAKLLIAAYLESRFPPARPLAALLTLLEPAEEQPIPPPLIHAGRLRRQPYVLDCYHFARLPQLLSDPVATLRAEYGSALTTAEEANALANKLFARLMRLLSALGVTCRYGFDPDDEAMLGDAAPLLQHALIIYADDALNGAAAESGVVLTLSSADQGDLGLVVCPFGSLTVTRPVRSWLLELTLTAGADVIAYGRHGLTLLASPSLAQVEGSLSAMLDAPQDGPAFIFGDPHGSRLEIGGAHLKAETVLSEAKQSVALSADVSSSTIVIAPGDGDGFLQSVLPADGLQTKFDLGVAWSSERGLTFRGTGSLEAALPVGLSIHDVLTVPTLHLSLRTEDARIRAEISADVGVTLGPVRVQIERIGLATDVTFPEVGGNLGIVDVDFHGKPPNGLGAVIDADVVGGGGFLHFDPQKAEYSGHLELQVAETLAVKATGLLTTRLPNNAKGYSLLVIITAEDFKPIPLGLGFSLTGMGGLLAINRTFAEDALRAGLKNHTVDSVLFPQDPMRNVLQILSTLQTVFPLAPGHHLFGPMVQIAWGTPPLITAELGLVLEFGAQRRLLMLGQVAAILPNREHDLVRLQMDALGVIDFDQGTAALDATLYDSRLLKKFVLTGDMAMRLAWETSPNFALAIGGLHHAFNRPANFPTLERIALNLTTGDNPRLRCEAYFAITSNTVQFGARAELFTAAHGFSILGEAGFDVLIQLDPFLFIAEFYAGMQLRRGSTNLFKVRFEGALNGPRPLHVKGKATFEILWWDVSIRVDKTLIAGEKPPLPAPVDVLPRLQEALRMPSNWSSQLPDGQRSIVTLRARSEAATEVQLHPLGTLSVKQSVVPLNLEINRFGSAAPAGARRFIISAGQNQTTQTVTEFFAPAQFLDMTDAEKLSRPSFEKMAAGIQIGSQAFAIPATDDVLTDDIGYETKLVTDEPPPPPEPPDTQPVLHLLTVDLLRRQAHFGAAGASELRRSGTAKYRGKTVGKHQVKKEGWSIVATDDLSKPPLAIADADGRTEVSYAVAAQELRKRQQEDPGNAARFKILRFRSEIGTREK